MNPALANLLAEEAPLKPVLDAGKPKVSERDMRHGADAARFAAAILKCEGYAPDCSYHGRCLHDGECFASPPHLVAARMIQKLLPPDGRAGAHFAYLRACVEQLRAGRIYP